MARWFAPALAVTAALITAACGPRDTERLIVLHTGRMFGNVYPQETRTIAPLQHYPYLASYVKQVRAEAAASGARVLLLDSGDSLGGSFASYATGSANVATLFNTLAYDAVFLGNLDANLDPRAIQQLRMPVLVPFVRPDGTAPLPDASPARAIDVSGLTVILAANFYGDTPASQYPQRFPMWFGPDYLPVEPVRTLLDWIPPLARSHPGAPILFHWMKFESPAEVPALVHQLKDLGVTAILAHRIYNSDTRDTWNQRDYSAWPLPVSENILRQNGGFTVARLDLVRRSGAWTAQGPHRIIQLTANTAPPDPDIIAAINQFAPAIRQADRPLAQLPQALSETDFLPRYAALLGATTPCDAVLYAASSIRAPLPADTLTANRLYAALPWTAPLASLQLDAAQWDQAARGLHAWKRPDAPATGTLRVTTSLYTARLLQTQLALPADAVRILEGGTEFDHAARAIATHPELIGATPVPHAPNP
jgi:2',3'-cyclic-nucleotide 2'-phosphodiesterase (5'-nucleotidase family)